MDLEEGSFASSMLYLTLNDKFISPAAEALLYDYKDLLLQDSNGASKKDHLKYPASRTKQLHDSLSSY